MARSARLDLRLAPEDDFLIRRAAEATGTTVSSFVVTSARTEAEHVLADRTVFALDPEGWEAFRRRLDEPARVKPELSKLFAEPDLFE